MQKIEYSISSLEAAEMLETEHWQLLRKLDGRTGKDGKHIKGYVEILGDNQMVVTDFFVKSTYQTEQNKQMPCYFITRKGCEFLANKFTGEKGVIFTARYVNRFHEMEEQLQRENHADWFVNDIRVFQHREFGILRTLKLDGQDYFIGKDVTTSLGYVNNTDTLKKRVSDAEKCYVGICDGNRNRKMVAITEKGLNELIQTGRLPLASKYSEWIHKQVLPALQGHELLEDKKETLPAKKCSQEISSVKRFPEMSDPIAIFRVLLDFADKQKIQIKSLPFKACKSVLMDKHIGIRKELTLEEVNFEIAYELSHALMHYDKGDLIKSPLAKYYNEQAEKAAMMLISLLDARLKIA